MGAENSSLNDLEFESAIQAAHPLWTVRHGTYDDRNAVTVLSDDNGDKEIRNLFSRFIKVIFLKWSAESLRK